MSAVTLGANARNASTTAASPYSRPPKYHTCFFTPVSPAARSSSSSSSSLARLWMAMWPLSDQLAPEFGHLPVREVVSEGEASPSETLLCLEHAHRDARLP